MVTTSSGMIVVESGMIAEFLPELEGSPWIEVFITAAGSQLAREFPGALADDAAASEVQLILLQAFERVANSSSFAKSQTNGPFSITYVTAGRGLFDSAERVALRGLTSTPAGLIPLGSFPEPGRYRHVFADPPAGLP